MTPERLGPFLLLERLHDLAGEAYRARRVVGEGLLSAPIVLELFPVASRQIAAEGVRAGEWGARVPNPDVIRVLEVGRVEQRLYVASELAAGQDLGTVLAAASSRGRVPSVTAALAIGAELARVAREVQEASGGRHALGLFRPRDVVLGYVGGVRVRASGVVERPGPGESRDPFLAPELARDAPLGPAADVWTVARVVRAVLAADPRGKRTPKLSARYKDSLGAILVEALARDPSARLPIHALERRLLDLALEDAEDLGAPILALLVEHEGGSLPGPSDGLGFEELSALADDRGPPVEVLFSLTREARDVHAEASVETAVGPLPAAVPEEVGSSIFGRAIAEAAREAALANEAGQGRREGRRENPSRTLARPRVELPSEDDVSLEAITAGEDVRLQSAAVFDDDVGALDLDAIARSSLAGQRPLEEDPALAGTAVVTRPPTLPPSQHDEGDVFAPAAPETKVSRLGSRARASLVSSGGGSSPAEPPGGDVFAVAPRAPAEEGVFTTTPSSGEPWPRPSAPSAPALDPDKTAYLDDPAAAFGSGLASLRGEPAARPLTPLSAVHEGDDEDQPTERLSADLVREAVLLARGAPADEPVEVTATGASVLEEELGRLVIDVPPEAVVFVNGEQHGRGPTTLEGLDRFASVVIRVHHRGHRPWTGTVSLKGMPAARVEPELVRRS